LKKQFKNKRNEISITAGQPDSKEIIGLCRTLDYNTIAIFNQGISKPNPTYYIGRGKVDEIAEFVSSNDKLEFAVLDCSLKPNQAFNLENKFRLRVIDRSTLILIIFLHHAKTKEAKLQIEYAILKHQIPYVTELVRRSKLGEHPGYMAGGEYKVDEYYRLTKTRIKAIREDLAKIKTSRGQQRKHRQRQGFMLVSLAGYTNAGKSSFLNVLTDARVLIEDRMFSTVSPKTRRFRRSRVLLTDTVGFIQNIPTQLIEAFKSTLEEIIDADHIMLIVDISEDIAIVKKKIITCLNTINQLIIERYIPANTPSPEATQTMRQPKFHLVFNKCDLEKNDKGKAKIILDDLSEELGSYKLVSMFFVSCKNKYGIDDIIEKLSSL